MTKDETARLVDRMDALLIKNPKETLEEEVIRLRGLVAYDLAHEGFQRDQIRYWKCVAASLILQLEEEGIIASVAEKDVYDDPPTMKTTYEPFGARMILTVVKDAKS